MAVSGTDKVMDTTKRDNLGTAMDSAQYKAAVGTAYEPKDFAGIKEGFVTGIDNAINEYIGYINEDLAKLENGENVNVKQAIRSPLTESALKALITAVKEEALGYATALKEAEKSIISQVRELYVQQGIAVSDSIKTDTNTLTGDGN